MQESGNKGKHAAKHAAETPDQIEKENLSAEQVSEEAEAYADEYDLYGDESEIPVRLRKNKKKDAQSGKKKSKKKKKKSGKVSDAVPPLFSDKKFRRKKSFFDVMTASTQESFIKPVKIFGQEVRYWPLLLLAVIVLIVGYIVISIW